MKKVFKIIALLGIVNLYSQDVKVKKNIVLIEKNEVCKLIKLEKNHYEIQDLNENKIFSFQIEEESITALRGLETFKYLKFSKPNDSQIYYSDYATKDLKFSFNYETTIIRHLISENEFISESGINYNKLKDFFSQPRPRSKTLEQKVAEYKEAYKVITDINLKFDNNQIIKGGAQDTFIGTYKFESVPNPNGINSISLSNNKLIKIFDATGFLTATYAGNTIRLFDRNEIKFYAVSNDNIENAQKVVERMIIGGYTLGDMQTKIANINRKKRQEILRDEMRNSDNIYNKKAIVYDAQGNTTEGVITLEFYELENKKSGMSSLNNYGGVATLKTLKENGNYTYTTYKAKDGVKICLEETGECYKGISTKGMKAPKFNLEIEVSGNLKLYKSITNEYYIIKKDTSENGLILVASTVLKKDNSENMFEDLFEYLNDCTGLKETLNTSEIDAKNEDDLMKIVTIYNSCN